MDETIKREDAFYEADNLLDVRNSTYHALCIVTDGPVTSKVIIKQPGAKQINLKLRSRFHSFHRILNNGAF
jgi:hypothetical protein